MSSVRSNVFRQQSSPSQKRPRWTAAEEAEDDSSGDDWNLQKLVEEFQRQRRHLENFGIRIWLWDRQLRPAFGTIALDKKQARRKDMSMGSVFQMYSHLSWLLVRCGVRPEGQCAFVYNATSPRSQAFHIKCFVDEKVYSEKYVPVAEKFETPPFKTPPGSEEVRQWEQRAKKDNYAPKIMSNLESGNNVPVIDGTTLLRATNSTILEIGPVVVWSKPIEFDFARAADAVDEEKARELASALDELEAEVLRCLKPKFFSVSVVPIPEDKAILAVKVDIECLIARLDGLEDLKMELSKTFQYQEPNRSYYNGRRLGGGDRGRNDRGHGRGRGRNDKGHGGDQDGGGVSVEPLEK